MPNNALILVDFENEWINPQSDYYVGDISDVIARTNKLIEHARNKGTKVIFTRHIEPNSTEEFAKNTRAVEIIDDLDQQASDTLITKYRISPFYQTTLEKELEGIKHLVVAGILTNLCVRSLVQDAYDRGFEITVITDCCVAFDQETQDFTIKDLKATREEINFITAQDYSK